MMSNTQTWVLPDAATPRLVRCLARARHLLNQAERASMPCGAKPANQNEARAKLALAVKELEAAL